MSDSTVRIAVSGSHRVGKSTLIASFLARRPDFASEPEAFELLADEIALLPSEGPDAAGLAALLEHTLAVLESETRDRVVYERCPVDYLAYAEATEALAPSERMRLHAAFDDAVRDALRRLDLVVLLPLVDFGHDQETDDQETDDAGFRTRVDEELQQALLDDAYDLFGDPRAPQVLELPADPRRQLDALVRWIEAAH